MQMTVRSWTMRRSKKQTFTRFCIAAVFQEFIDFIGKKNLQSFEAITGGDKDMGEYLMELLRPRIEKEKQEAVQAAVQAAVQNSTIQNLYLYVQDGGLPVDYASKRANQTPEVFIANMSEAGYRVPEAST